MKKIKQVLAIDIGSSCVKFLVLDLSGTNIKLLKTKLIELPEPAEGKKEEIIKTSLQEFLKENPSVRNTYISLSNPYVDIERLEFPKMPQEEIKDAVQLKLKEKIPAHAEEYIVDFLVTDEYTKEDGAKTIVAMAAIASRKEIEPILNMMQDLHLNIIFINAITFGLVNIMQYKKGASPEETIALVEIGDKHTMVSLYKSNKFIFARNIPIYSSQLTEAMCGVLVSDKGRIELTHDEAQNIKIKYGYPIDQTEILDNKIIPGQVVAMIRPQLEHLANEIKRTFTYYSSQLKGSLPDKVYITGGGAKLKNLDKFLKEQLKTDVQPLDLPKNIINMTNEDNQSLLSFLGVIGSALPTSGKMINLLPPEIKTQKVEYAQKISIRMLTFIALCITILLYAGIKIRTSGLQKQLESAKAFGNVLKKIQNLHDEFVEWGEAVAVAENGDIPIQGILKDISNTAPYNIVLTELTIDLNIREVNFKGALYPETELVENELTKFIEGLEKTKFIKDATLISVKKENGGTRTAIFEINGTL